MAAEDSRKKDDAEDSQKEELITGFEVGVRVFFAKYGSYLLLAAAFALLGWQIWNYFQKKHQVAVQEAWLDFEQAEQSPDDLPAKLQGVIADHDIKPVQAQAWLALGNYYVGTVALGVAPNVPGAKYDRTEQLNRAEDAYRHILDGFSDERVVAGAAHMGMGVVAEDQGNWDEARKQDEALTDSKSEFAGTACADQASDRGAKLKE